jgi:DNA-binding PadR family transcriptional regulator
MKKPGTCSISRYMLILSLVKRKPGALLPLEVDICAAARRLRHEFHGFELAKSLTLGHDSKRLTAYGTLYRALGRLEAMGLLTSRWEDPQAENEGRPLRRLYRLTDLGERALAESAAQRVVPADRRRKWVPA